MGALDIAIKDLRLLARDKRAAVVLLALPMIFITIIGLSTGQLMSAREGGEKVNIAVIDRTASAPAESARPAPETPSDTSAPEPNQPAASENDAAPADEESDAPARRLPLSRQVIDTIKKHERFLVHEMEDQERARESLDRGDVILIVIIGEDFPARVADLKLGDILRSSTGRLAAGPSSLDITIETKPSLAKIGELAGAVIFGDVVRTIASHVSANTDNLFVKQAYRVAAQREKSQPPPAVFQSVTLIEQEKAPTSIVYENLVPSYTVLFVFFLVNIMARSFIAERDLGTLRRLRMAPLRRVTVLVGKTIPFFLLSLVQTALLFLFGRLLFGMSWGYHPWLLVPVIVCTSLAATALGLMVATLIRTDSQVSAYANSLVIILAGISGCFLPREWLPDLMQQISLGTPHAWALIAYDEILSHRSVLYATVLKSCGMLLAFSAAFFAIGWFRFRRVDE